MLYIGRRFRRNVGTEQAADSAFPDERPLVHVTSRTLLLWRQRTFDLPPQSGVGSEGRLCLHADTNVRKQRESQLKGGRDYAYTLPRSHSTAPCCHPLVNLRALSSLFPSHLSPAAVRNATASHPPPERCGDT